MFLSVSLSFPHQHHQSSCLEQKSFATCLITPPSFLEFPTYKHVRVFARQSLKVGLVPGADIPLPPPPPFQPYPQPRNGPPPPPPPPGEVSSSSSSSSRQQMPASTSKSLQATPEWVQTSSVMEEELRTEVNSMPSCPSKNDDVVGRVCIL